MIIHGWQIANEKIDEKFQNDTIKTVVFGDWVFKMQEAILEKDDVNVIIHDWRTGALQGYM